MACGTCSGRKVNQQFKWTGVDSEGNELVVVYPTEMQAKAKVLRKGGSYTPVEG